MVILLWYLRVYQVQDENENLQANKSSDRFLEW